MDQASKRTSGADGLWRFDPLCPPTTAMPPPHPLSHPAPSPNLLLCSSSAAASIGRGQDVRVRARAWSLAVAARALQLLEPREWGGREKRSRRRWWGCSSPGVGRLPLPVPAKAFAASDGEAESEDEDWGIIKKELKTEETGSGVLNWCDSAIQVSWIRMPNWCHSRCRGLAIAHGRGLG